jgi:DNA-binding NarL/FixJ family response regulator
MGADPAANVFILGGESRSLTVLQEMVRGHCASVQCFSTPEECLSQLAKTACDILIIDHDGNSVDGLELIPLVRQLSPGTSSLVLLRSSEIRTAVLALKMGAADCIEKPVEESKLIPAIEAGLGGRRPAPRLTKPLSETEIRVLHLVLLGNTSGQVGAVLHRSRRTIEAHRRSIMGKLGVSNLAGLARRAIELGLVSATE